jgi:hypothetical protein
MNREIVVFLYAQESKSSSRAVKVLSPLCVFCMCFPHDLEKLVVRPESFFTVEGQWYNEPLALSSLWEPFSGFALHGATCCAGEKTLWLQH